jgi:hypothetical protein
VGKKSGNVLCFWTTSESISKSFLMRLEPPKKETSWAQQARREDSHRPGLDSVECQRGQLQRGRLGCGAEKGIHSVIHLTILY